MKQKLVSTLLLLSFSFLMGCGVSVREGLFYEPNLPTLNTKADPFLNKDVSYTNKNCEGGFCSQFKIIGDDEAYWYVGYRGDDWLFLKNIQMKVKGTDITHTLKGKFDREVKYGGTVEEILTVRIDQKNYALIKSFLGNSVIVRLNGDQYYRDVEFEVRDDPKRGLFSMFIENFKPKFEDSSDKSKTETAT